MNVIVNTGSYRKEQSIDVNNCRQNKSILIKGATAGGVCSLCRWRDNKVVVQRGVSHAVRTCLAAGRSGW